MAFSPPIALAQEEAKPDSSYNLDDLDFGDLDSITVDEFENFYYSSGYFPMPIPDHWTLEFLFPVSFMIEQAKNINPPDFVNVGLPFSAKNHLDLEEREIRQPDHRSKNKHTFPLSEAWGLGFRLNYSTILPVIFETRLSFDWYKSLLMTPAKKYHFLRPDGSRKKVKETGIMFLNEKAITASLGINFPIYGAFLRYEQSLASYYQLHLGVTQVYNVYSKATQYMQINKPKNYLRYRNGRDTMRLVSEKKLPGINNPRYYLDIGLGWDFEADGAGLSASIIYSYPITYVLSTARWRNHLITINLGIQLSVLKPLIKIRFP